MARMMNALQLALGSVGSGIQGYGQARAAREEQERQAEVFKRQQEMDTENRQFRIAELMSQGFEAGDNPPQPRNASPVGNALATASGGSALPPPTPAVQPALARSGPARTVTVGNQKYTLRETSEERRERLGEERAVADQKKLDAEILKAEKKATLEQQRLDKLADDALKGGPRSKAAVKLALENASAYKAIFDDQSGGASSAKRDQRMEDTRTAEAWFNTPIADPQQRKQVAAIFNNLRAAKPNAPPQELILDTFNAVKASAGLENTRAQTAQRSQAAQPSAMDSLLSGGIFAGISEAQKRSMRSELWESTKAANPSMSDSEITSRVMREIP
jgi:hypothetical protein